MMECRRQSAQARRRPSGATVRPLRKISVLPWLGNSGRAPRMRSKRRRSAAAKPSWRGSLGLYGKGIAKKIRHGEGASRWGKWFVGLSAIASAHFWLIRASQRRDLAVLCACANRALGGVSRK